MDDVIDVAENLGVLYCKAQSERSFVDLERVIERCLEFKSKLSEGERKTFNLCFFGYVEKV